MTAPTDSMASCAQTGLGLDFELLHGQRSSCWPTPNGYWLPSRWLIMARRWPEGLTYLCLVAASDPNSHNLSKEATMRLRVSRRRPGPVELRVIWMGGDITWERLSNVNDCAAMEKYLVHHDLDDPLLLFRRKFLLNNRIQAINEIRGVRQASGAGMYVVQHIVPTVRPCLTHLEQTGHTCWFALRAPGVSVPVLDPEPELEDTVDADTDHEHPPPRSTRTRCARPLRTRRRCAAAAAAKMAAAARMCADFAKFGALKVVWAHSGRRQGVGVEAARVRERAGNSVMSGGRSCATFGPACSLVSGGKRKREAGSRQCAAEIVRRAAGNGRPAACPQRRAVGNGCAGSGWCTGKG
ncbi:hypothetical protein GGX14DRAFT_407272 [Mycena pura]|uniref:Uncharacterized protein n=1 Tax=Mycena pura TaxID=153505 RepID=A0AAD6UNF5_9AGAR|nr:hypothetical protein GGX14DRAFT_407272 [Mycena pura]